MRGKREGGGGKDIQKKKKDLGEDTEGKGAVKEKKKRGGGVRKKRYCSVLKIKRIANGEKKELNKK